jgi:Ca-activated chloride channel family protein
MTFASGDRLWLLLAVVAVACLYVVAQRRRGQYAVRFTNVALLEAVAPNHPGWRRHATAFGFIAALLALVLAFAQPSHASPVPRERATVIVAIDTSLSMNADDVTPTRLQAAKTAATAFVAQLRPTLNVGLVSFHGTAELLVPPTTDRAKVRRAISTLSLGEGTAIGEAIFTSLDAIAQQTALDAGTAVPARIVLMSDGETNVGRPNDAAATTAARAKVPVDTIAFGTDHGTVIVPGEDAPVPVPVNRGALQRIANQTSGTFHSATTGVELAQAYQDIGSSIGSETKQTDISIWFIGSGLLALAATAAMSLTWFQRLP